MYAAPALYAVLEIAILRVVANSCDSAARLIVFHEATKSRVCNAALVVHYCFAWLIVLGQGVLHSLSPAAARVSTRLLGKEDIGLQALARAAFQA